MKYSIFTLLMIIFGSCTSKKNAPTIKETQPLTQLKSIVDTLTIEESNIINDFLDFELASERYKNKTYNEIIVIENAGNGIKNLLAYEYSYGDFHSYGNKAMEINAIEWISFIASLSTGFLLAYIRT